MNSFMQTMAEVVQAMQHMMMSYISAGLAVPVSIVSERPKRWSQRWCLMELENMEGFSCSQTSLKPNRLCKRRQTS